MDEQRRAIIDLTAAVDRESLYQEIYGALGVTDCGKNLDALWDTLTGMELAARDFVILRGSYEDERFAGYVRHVCGIFREAAQTDAGITVTVFVPETDGGMA